jgi:hypothetical protein
VALQDGFKGFSKGGILLASLPPVVRSRKSERSRLTYFRSKFTNLLRMALKSSNKSQCKSQRVFRKTKFFCY